MTYHLLILSSNTNKQMLWSNPSSSNIRYAWYYLSLWCPYFIISQKNYANVGVGAWHFPSASASKDAWDASSSPEALTELETRFTCPTKCGRTVPDFNRTLSLRYAPNPSRGEAAVDVVSTNQVPLRSHMTSFKDGEKMAVILTDEDDYMQPRSSLQPNYIDIVGSTSTNGRWHST